MERCPSQSWIARVSCPLLARAYPQACLSMWTCTMKPKPARWRRRQAMAEAERESTRYAVEALGVTKEGLIAKYESIAEDARAAGQHNTAVNAYKEVSILSGHRVERQEIGAANEFAAIEAMSRAELIEFIEATLESGELALEHRPESDQGNERV